LLSSNAERVWLLASGKKKTLDNKNIKQYE
jgi:hypothetical protein